MAKTERSMTEAQRLYEQRRAAKAGMTLDKWLDAKDRKQAVEAKPAAKPVKPKKNNLLTRLMDRARKPLSR